MKMENIMRSILKVCSIKIERLHKLLHSYKSKLTKLVSLFIYRQRFKADEVFSKYWYVATFNETHLTSSLTWRGGEFVLFWPKMISQG